MNENYAKDNGNHNLLSEGYDELTGHSVIFEDDGKTAYAYLLHDDIIVADVWLYNHNNSSSPAEWDNPSNRPFANLEEFAFALPIKPIMNPNEVQYIWIHSKQDELVAVEIHLRGELFGRLTPTSTPGWSKLARKDGPLAKVLIL